MPVRPYDPLDKHNIGESIVNRLISTDCVPLPVPGKKRAAKFEGAGIYAIYYLGDFNAYEDLGKKNRENGESIPIYIGKADPKGGRKGELELDAGIGTSLYDRLRDHAKSIDEAENLELAEFCCRYLAVDEVWIGLAERLAIQKFLPIWNTLVDGFGNHDPGTRRAEQYLSDWDTLHPGRKFAEEARPVTHQGGRYNSENSRQAF